MKKYFLFALVLLGLTFACNQPTPDGENNTVGDAPTVEESSTNVEENKEQPQEAVIDDNKAAVKEHTGTFITEISSVIELGDEDKVKLEALSNAHAQSIAHATRERDKVKLERKMWDESLSILDDEQVKKLKGFLEEKWDKEDAEFKRKRDEKLAEERRVKIKNMREAARNNK